MLFIGFTVVSNVIFQMTLAFECKFNSNEVLSRKAIVLRADNKDDIEITDATINIDLSNVDNKTKTRNVNKIAFTGKITQGKENKYYDDENFDQNPLTYRSSRRDISPGESRCKVAFRHNRNNKQPENESEQHRRSTILRLAESCIKAQECDINQYEVDKDTDLRYQSVQSNINDLVDFYLPRIINNFVVDDNSIELLKECPPGFKPSVVKCSGVRISGLNSIKRASDISITKVNNSRFDINAIVRFPKFNLSFDALELLSQPQTTSKFIAGAVSFNLTLSFVFGERTCQGSVLQLDLKSLETVPDDLIHGNLEKMELILPSLKSSFNDYTKGTLFDCQQYVKLISDEIGGLIKANNANLQKK